jgi:uncharacterized protein YjcR
MMHDSTEAYFTTNQLAERYGIKPKTVRNWRYMHTGPAYYQIPKLGRPSISEKIRYKLSDVLAWEQTNNITPIN